MVASFSDVTLQVLIPCFHNTVVVSAIGAFTVGLLGNMYSRKMGGTAFTSMVTGVLFLVPVSFALTLPCVVK